MKFYTFYTNNLPQQLIEDHKKVCDYIGIDVIYHSEDFTEYDNVYTAHGKFMTSVMQSETDDVVCFLDIDCLPHNKKNLEWAYEWAKLNNSFVGNAQNIFHEKMVNHLYAAASCLFVSKKGWDILGKPCFSYFYQGDAQIDTAQILSLRADQIGLPYRLMYPIGYDEKDPGSIINCWELGTYGHYGTGTLYPATYHYFRISKFKEQIPDLWTTRVNNVLGDQKIISNYSCLPYEL
jgi:hypothetical protein